MEGWCILLMKIIKKKKSGQDNQSFWKISSKRNNFICYITKIFFCTHLTILLTLTFSIFLFKQSINTLKFNASASAFYCFQICKIIALQFEILAILYFYRVIIILKLTLQQVLLVIELNEVRNFCPHLSGFSIPFSFENM